MATILPVQGRFDQAIPQDFGNAEYRQERELLIVIDGLIALSDLERPVIDYFLDVADVNKFISVWGIDQSAQLTDNERFKVHAHAVMALRMAILRKRLNLSLRKFSLALSHSDLYQWFCGINRFALPQVPGKRMIGELENSLPSELTDEVERRLFQAVQEESLAILPEPLDFSHCYFDCTCISANIHHPVDWLLLRDATRTLLESDRPDSQSRLVSSHALSTGRLHLQDE